MKILLFARLVFLRFWEFLVDEFTVFHIAVLSRRQLFSFVAALDVVVVAAWIIIISIIIAPSSLSLHHHRHSTLHSSYTHTLARIQVCVLKNLRKKIIGGGVWAEGGRRSNGRREEEKTKSKNLLVRFVAVGQTS